MGKQLTEEQLDKYAEVHAATDSHITAMLAVQPELAAKPAVAHNKALRVYKRPDVKQRIDKKLAQMSVKAMKVIDKTLQSENEQLAAQNAWKVIEHNIGTPVKRSVNLNAQATVEDVLFG